MFVTASRSERSQAPRGKLETSGALARKLKRGRGAGGVGWASGSRATVAASDTPGPGALAEDEVALGGKLCVGVDRDAPR